MNIERKGTLAAPPEAVLAVLNNVDNLQLIVPRAERVDVLQRGEGRARIAVTALRQRIEGEARLLDDGLRFVAVVPVELDVRWTVRAHGDGSEITLRVDVDLGKRFGAFASMLSSSIIGRQVGVELDASLDALAGLVSTDTSS